MRYAEVERLKVFLQNMLQMAAPALRTILYVVRKTNGSGRTS